jgi:hypothetical protein
VSRRVSLPGADLLFRPTPHPDAPEPPPAPAQEPEQAEPASAAPPRQRRRRHDEKITVYVSEEQLLELEQARLRLRAAYGLAVDRGRIVREAVAAALADLDERGTGSTLVERLAAGEP